MHELLPEKELSLELASSPSSEMREVALRTGGGGRPWEELMTLLPFPTGPFYGRELTDPSLAPHRDGLMARGCHVWGTPTLTPVRCFESTPSRQCLMFPCLGLWP